MPRDSLRDSPRAPTQPPASPHDASRADAGGSASAPDAPRRAERFGFRVQPELGWRPMLRSVAWITAGLVVAAGVGAGAWLWLLWNDTPGAAEAARRASHQPSQVVSSDGQTLQALSDVVHTPVRLEQVSPALRHALLATEDRRFLEHGGIDVRRLLAAVGHTLGGEVQGGSTLTQQLARNLFPDEVGRERSLRRKLRELVVAIKLERAYDKDTLLQMYLNEVPYLYNVVGVGAAAQTYFGKPISALGTHEAALLVAMLKGPAQYDPERYPARALARRNLVLRAMVDDGRLDAREAAAARAKPLGVNVARQDTVVPPAAHYLRLVRQQLQPWAQSAGIDLQRDGLRIHVALDTRQQALAERAVAEQTQLLQQVAAAEWSRADLRPGPARTSTPFAHLWRQRPDLLNDLARATPAYRRARQAGSDEAAALAVAWKDPALPALQADRTRLEAGFVAMDPRNGAVRAYVGSRGFEQDRYDHVTQARRQPGSTFKPFVYGAALLGGMSAEQQFVDQVLTYTTAEGKEWAPTDAGGATGEAMTLRTGLARSRNTITAQVMQAVGPRRVAALARELGVDRSPLLEVPSLALGTSPVTLLEMTQAYATLASLGLRRSPILIERIEDRDGRVLFMADHSARRVYDPDHAAVLVDMLRDAVNLGTGTALRQQFGVKGDVAGKTGTTQRNTDAWFIAMHPTLVSGAWVGFNDPRVTLRSSDWGQGGRSALRLVGDFMSALQKQGGLPLDQRFPAVQRPPAPPSEDLMHDESDADGGAAPQHDAADTARPLPQASATPTLVASRGWPLEEGGLSR